MLLSYYLPQICSKCNYIYPWDYWYTCTCILYTHRPYTVAAMTSPKGRPIRSRCFVATGNVCRYLLTRHSHNGRHTAQYLIVRDRCRAIYRRDTPLVSIELSVKSLWSIRRRLFVLSLYLRLLWFMDVGCTRTRLLFYRSSSFAIVCSCGCVRVCVIGRWFWVNETSGSDVVSIVSDVLMTINIERALQLAWTSILRDHTQSLVDCSPV